MDNDNQDIYDEVDKIYYKRSKKEFLEKFLEGQLYFNHYSFFQKIEEDNLQKDLFEGLTNISNKPAYVSFRKPNTDLWKLGGITTRQSQYFSDQLPYTHIFCFSYHKFDTYSKLNVQNKDLDFGDNGEFVLFTKDHLKIIIKHLTLKGLNPICKQVKYIDFDKVDSIQLDGFTKHIKYEKQQEMRIGITLPNTEGITIDMDIKWFSTILDVNTEIEILNTDKKVTPKNL